MALTASKLRQDVYRILDQVLETGVPVEVERRGRILKIVPLAAPSKFSNLVQRDVMIGDPDNFVHIDWSKEWRP